LKARIRRLRIPALDFDRDLGKWVQQMRRLDAPVIFNLENWGMSGEELPGSLVHQETPG
jgi:poly(3-hydroxyalkanoate) synthetase